MSLELYHAYVFLSYHHSGSLVIIMCSDMYMCLDHVNQVFVWMRKAIISPHVYGFVAH